MHSKCCSTPRNDVLNLDKKDKSCPNPNGKTFNNYMMNKQQDSTKNFTINYYDEKINKALAKDAVSFLIL